MPYTPNAKIVVAGGTGMLGSRLCPYLVDRGYEVVVLTRNNRPARKPDIRYVTWNPQTRSGWAHEIEDAHAVINLCGEIIAGKRWTEKRKTALIHSRTEPSRALVAAVQAAEKPPAVFLQASGVGYYGPGAQERTEQSSAGSDWLATLAVAWETPLNELTTRHVALRLGVVLDTHGGALPQMVMPFRFFVGGKIAGGKQWFCWVHIQDVLRAIEFLLNDESISGPVNVASPRGINNAELTAAISKVMKRPALFNVPRFVMHILLGEQATLVCDGQNVAPVSLLSAGFQFDYAEIEPALLNLIGR